MKAIKLSLLILCLCNSIYTQTFNVRGNISAGTIPVKYVSITFVDQSDTLKKFTAITDTLGNYNLGIPTAVHNETFVQPADIELKQNYPNPFSSTTAIPYKINNRTEVKVTIYDILGREIKKFTVGMQAVGLYGIQWDGKDTHGTRISSGVYFYRLQTKSETLVKKMVYTGGSPMINVPIFSGMSLCQQKLQKEGIKQIVTGTYSVQITNTDSTTPTVTEQNISNITLQNDTTLNFQLNEADDFVICYEKFLNNQWEIFLNNIKGTHPKNISNYAGDDEYPRWSPDGKYIVYYSRRGRLAVYDIQNQTNTLLTSDTMEASQMPFWTPNGKICFAYRGPYYTSPWETFIMNPDGSNWQKIKVNPSTLGVSLFYQDSYTCLYVDSNKVYKTNIDSTFNEFILNLEPMPNKYFTIRDFNPLTGELLVNTNDTPDTSKAIAEFNAETKQLSVLVTAEKSFSLVEQRYSKDFSKIVFLEFSTPDTAEYLSIFENGTKIRLIRLTKPEWFDYNPMQFSPSDKYVAFSKNIYQGGQYISWRSYLYIIDVTTGVLRYIDEGHSPTWNPHIPQLYRRK